MKLRIALLLLGILTGSTPALAAGLGQGCDTRSGRDGGQQMCDAGLSCTGPFEGSFGHGNCQRAQVSQAGQGCDTKPGRDSGQQMCATGLSCTGPFEGSFGRGNCQ